MSTNVKQVYALRAFLGAMESSAYPGTVTLLSTYRKCCELNDVTDSRSLAINSVLGMSRFRAEPSVNERLILSFFHSVHTTRAGFEDRLLSQLSIRRSVYGLPCLTNCNPLT